MIDIIENGEELVVNDKQFVHLLDRGMIYNSLDGYFHAVDNDIDGLEEELKKVGLGS